MIESSGSPDFGHPEKCASTSGLRRYLPRGSGRDRNGVASRGCSASPARGRKPNRIKADFGQFLDDELKLELSPTKTLITHERTRVARFLGNDAVTLHVDHKHVTIAVGGGPRGFPRAPHSAVAGHATGRDRRWTPTVASSQRATSCRNASRLLCACGVCGHRRRLSHVRDSCENLSGGLDDRRGRALDGWWSWATKQVDHPWQGRQVRTGQGFAPGLQGAATAAPSTRHVPCRCVARRRTPAVAIGLSNAGRDLGADSGEPVTVLGAIAMCSCCDRTSRERQAPTAPKQHTAFDHHGQERSPAITPRVDQPIRTSTNEVWNVA